MQGYLVSIQEYFSHLSLGSVSPLAQQHGNRTIFLIVDNSCCGVLEAHGLAVTDNFLKRWCNCPHKSFPTALSVFELFMCDKLLYKLLNAS